MCRPRIARFFILVSGSVMPQMSVSSPIIYARTSATSTYSRGDKGQPWHTPFSSLKVSEMKLFTFTQLLTSVENLYPLDELWAEIESFERLEQEVPIYSVKCFHLIYAYYHC